MSAFILYALIAGYFISGTIGTLYLWAAYSERFKHYRLRTPEQDRITVKQRLIVIPANMAFSVALILTALYFFTDNWVKPSQLEASLAAAWKETSLATIFGEVVAVLLVYDLIYYWFHRVFHHKNLMKLMHGTHHRARFPTAWDGLYLNPAENFAGLFILAIALTLFSPVSAISFVLIIFIHTLVNILVHTNMVFPHPAFMLFNYWAIKHDIHHGAHLNKNYSNIFPYWDMMFGSYK